MRALVLARGWCRPRRASRGRAVVLATALWTTGARALDPHKAPSQYVTHVWQQSADGLPQNFVPSLVQTRDGYLWLGTQEGLVRFDGERFVVYSAGAYPELGTNDIDVVAASSRGGVWIGTRGAGLVYYDGARFTPYGTKAGLPHDVVTAVLETPDGAVWVGTRGGGAAILRDGRFTTLRTSDGLAGDSVSAIVRGADGSIWLGTDAGVSRWQDGHFTSVRAGLSAPTVNALYADPDGTLWIGTIAGLDRYKDGSITPLPVPGPVHALLRDGSGSLWIAAQPGLRRLSSSPGAEGTATPFGALASLDSDGAHKLEAAALVEDHEGNLWAGMETTGLARIQDGKVTTFGTDFLWTTFLDAKGTLWLGGDPGVFTLQDGQLVAVPGASSLAVVGMTQGADGTIWIGSDERGLYTYSGGKLAKFDTGLARSEISIRSIFTDSRGAIWFGTNYGLSRIDAAGKPTHFHPADGVPDMAIRAFAESPDGTMWIGASGGLLRYKDGKFVFESMKDGLPPDPIESLASDGDDLWIGTYGGGLALRRGDRYGRVTTRSGLFNDVIFAIVDDGQGDLWMSCNRGVFHAKKEDLVAVALGTRSHLECTALNTSDGMRSAECNSGVPGGVRSRDGLLWFPTSSGVVRIDPGRMRKNVVVPPVHIEEARVDRAPVDLATLKELPPASRDFEFVYTALSFTATERVRFKYRLEGYDKDWIDAGTRRVAYYTNLAPGRYAFRVIAANDDGVWNEDGARVAFVLLPHFWQTLWFRLACALGLVMVGAGSVRLRLRALRLKAEELERKVELRTKELAAANTQLEGAFRSLREKDERLHEDLLQAKAFQERILPRLPSGGTLRFRAVYRPADLVGGDVYDVCELQTGHYRVFLADTTGHGVQASLRTMVLKTEYDRVKESTEGPAHVLWLLNQKLATVYPGLEMRCSACCFDVIADDDGATVRYSNAAHPPLLRAGNGQVDEIYASGTFLGIAPDATFRQVDARLAPTDRLLAYTDGICEQEDANGLSFGMERMERLLADRPRSADEIVRDLDRALTDFAGGRVLDDDVVLVCIECAGDRRSLAGPTSATWTKPG
jgi:ligand-binding sensor domain-containing protein/serine phosphatase RsbU (regulator of sigma subunit)